MRKTGAPTFVLGGVNNANDNGNLWSQRGLTGSDILLWSNDEIHLHLDEDNDEGAEFIAYAGNNMAAVTSQEDGDCAWAGICT